MASYVEFSLPNLFDDSEVRLVIRKTFLNLEPVQPLTALRKSKSCVACFSPQARLVGEEASGFPFLADKDDAASVSSELSTCSTIGSVTERARRQGKRDLQPWQRLGVDATAAPAAPEQLAPEAPPQLCAGGYMSPAGSSSPDAAPSEGSKAHGAVGADGLPVCHPCAWFYKKSGCMKGSACQYCHVCPRDEIKLRKRKKVMRLRSQQKVA